MRLKKATAWILGFAMVGGILSSCHMNTVQGQQEENADMFNRSFVCPSKQQTLHAILGAAKNMPPSVQSTIKILDVKFDDKQGLDMCEVTLEINGQKQAVFMTPDGHWIIVGGVINATTGENILAQINNKLQQQEMEKQAKSLAKMDLNKYVAYVYYNGKSYYNTNAVPQNAPYIYFITDPKCPFCHETEKPLMDWANKHHVAIRVIVLPLPIHPGSFRTSVGLYCNKKGLNSLHEAYNSSSFLSQCSAGKQYEKMIRKEVMPKIQGTPTFIGMNGKVIPGAIMNEKEFNMLISNNTNSNKESNKETTK